MTDKTRGEKRFFAGWWLWITLLLVVSTIVFGALNALGIIGRTAVERVVFEQSYQRKAGDNAKLNTFIAEKASLESQLRRNDLSSAQRSDYEAQLAAINIQINSIKGQ